MKTSTAFVVSGGSVRVCVYIDGFNLYYRALKGGPYKWADLASLTTPFLQHGEKIHLVRYFTARVSARAGDPDAPRRQQIFFSALETFPIIKFHYGSFLSKTKKRPLVSNPKTFVEIHDTEEKGSDVNLAVHLVNDGWCDRYDTAFVLSQDTDLVEPLRIVTQELKKKVGLIWLDNRSPDRRLHGVSTFVRHLRTAHLAAHQLPNPVIRADGTKIQKPANW